MATRNIPAPSNPYASGAVVFDSTPYTEFYIREQQKEQAKDEALDKYFMDWDKSINPAGMRNVDTQDFLNLMNENKGFFFKNKAAIKNPALDNGAAYNEWFARNKSAMGLVSQSKEIASKEEQINKAILQAKQKGLPITDRVVADLEVFRQPIKSKNWRDFNPDNLDFEPKPFDPIRFTKDMFSDIEFDEKLQSETKIPETKTIRRVYETSMPEKALGSVYSRAAASYKTSPSVKEFVDMTVKNPTEYKKLNELFTLNYKRPIQNSEDAAAAIALTFSPVGKQREQVVDDKAALMKLSNDYISSRQRASASGKKSSAADTFDFITKGLEVAKSGNSELLNNYFSAWKVGQKTDIRGGKIGFQSAKLNPNGEIEIVYSSGINTRGGTVANPNLITEKIKINDPQAKNKLLQLDQQFLGGDVKTERTARSEAGTTPTTNQPKQKEVKQTKEFVFPQGKTKF
jgi:hypothetical protein